MSWVGTALGRSVGAAWRHRWTFAVPVATLLLPATIYALRQPDVFRARAVVFVRPLESAQVGGALPQERVAQAHELVQTSRDRLLTQANAAALVPVLTPQSSVADPMAVSAVKERILWDRVGDSAFAVSIDDVEAGRAALAVNTLLRAFQENERSLKLSQAEGLLHSHESGLAGVRAEHDKALAALDAFRARSADALPEQEHALEQELAQLRSEITWQEQSANAARERGRFLSEQIARWGATAADPAVRRTSAEEDKLAAQLTEQQRAASDVRRRLNEERTVRTDRHPEVLAKQRELAVLEADVKATVAALDAARRMAAERDVTRHVNASRGAVDDLKSMRVESLAEEKRNAQAAQDLRERVKQLQERLQRIPATKPQLLKLEREAEDVARRVTIRETAMTNVRGVVEHLRSASANDVTGYRVDEWAVAPALPYGPARARYLAVAVGLGLLLGYGLRVLQRRYDVPAVTSIDDLSDLVPGALVVTVPLLPEGGRRRLRVPWADLALGLWVVLALGSTVLAVAARKGWVHGPAWLETLVGRGA